MPPDMLDAHLLFETGWSPDELDNVSEERLARFVIYKNVRFVHENGGELY